MELKRNKPPVDIPILEQDHPEQVKWRPGLRPVPFENYYQDPMGVPRGPERTRRVQ